LIIYPQAPRLEILETVENFILYNKIFVPVLNILAKITYIFKLKKIAMF